MNIQNYQIEELIPLKPEWLNDITLEIVVLHLLYMHYTSLTHSEATNQTESIYRNAFVDLECALRTIYNSFSVK